MYHSHEIYHLLSKHLEQSINEGVLRMMMILYNLNEHRMVRKRVRRKSVSELSPHD